MNRETFLANLTAVCVVLLVIAVLVLPISIWIYNDSQNVTYIGVIINLTVRQVPETYEEQFLVSIRLDTGDSRVFRMPTNESWNFFKLEKGKRYNLSVRPSKETTPGYSGIIKNVYKLEDVVYESAS